MRLSYLLPLLLLSVSTSSAFGQLNHIPSELSEVEAQEINNLCKDLLDQYQINLLIRISDYNNKTSPGTTTSRQHYLYLNLGLKDKICSLTSDPFSVGMARKYEAHFQKILIDDTGQWTYLGRDLKRCVQLILDTENKKKTNQEDQRIQREKDENYTPEAHALSMKLILITIIFILHFIFKSLKKGHNIENSEFSGFSRLSTTQSFLLFLAIAFGILYYSATHFKRIDQILIIITAVFSIYPLMIYSAAVLYFIKDAIALIKLEPNYHSLSMGAKLLLLKPNIPTDFLLEVNFLELLMKNEVKLKITSTQHQYSTQHLYIVNIHQSVNGGKNSYLPFLKSEEDETPIDLYIKSVYKRVGRFKSYRKDLLYRELLESNLITGSSWLFNRIVLTEKGEAYLKNLKKAIQHQEHTINQWLSGQIEDHDKTEITPIILLSSRKEQLFYDLRQIRMSLNSNYRLDKLPSALLDENFDFRIFRSHLFRASTYKFEWAKTADSDVFY